MGAYSLVSLWDMLQLPLSKLIDCTYRFGALSQTFTGAAQGKGTITLPPFHLDFFMDYAKELAAACNATGMVVSAQFAHEVGVLLDTAERMDDGSSHFAQPRIAGMNNALRTLLECVERESRTKRALMLSPANVMLYEPPEPFFDADVLNKFPSASFEINEAAKCLALGRETASVFHLMRLTGLGLKAVYRCLEIPEIPRRSSSWGTLINRINDDLVKRGGDKWQKHDYFQSLSVQLNAIRHAQRNNTMHVTTTYNYEEGKLIFDNTKVLMIRIASQMDQNGLPLA